MALSSRSLGTAALSRGPGAHPQLMTAPTAPERARTAPILRSIDEDVQPVPPVPMMMQGRSRGRSPGRSLTHSVISMPPIPETPTQPRALLRARGLAPPSAPAIVPPKEEMPDMPAVSPSDDFIPIMHQRVPTKIRTQVPPPPPSPSDDGYTPITPAPTPKPKFSLSRGPTSPRDALGIPVSKVMFGRSKSKRDVDGDTEPLSPSEGLYRGVDTLPVPVQSKPKRKTVWGVLDGWWDLGLLERGKSLRRKT